MRRILFILFIICCSITWGLAQSEKVDQLKKELDTTQGKERVEILLSLTQEHIKTDQREAKGYAKDALKLSEDLAYPKGVVASSFALSILERDAYKNRKAIRYAETSLQVARTMGDDLAALRAVKMLEILHRLEGNKQEEQEYKDLYLTMKESINSASRGSASRTSPGKTANPGEDILAKAHKEIEETRKELEVVEAEKLKREAELSRAEMERARLETEAAELEKDAAMSQLKLNKERNFRNLILAISGLLVFILFGIWQRYRLVQQRKSAELEKQRVERLQEIDRIKDEFLANTSHELRTPLNGIIGIAESLYSNFENRSKAFVLENLAIMISAGKRLNNLINDIMDFSRLKNAELDINRKSLDIYAISNVILRISQPLTRGKELELINQIPEDISPVYGDENRIQQILHNLVGNAMKFTDKGTVTVFARESGETVEIGVRDTGIGISKDRQELIFQAFQQADGSIARTHGGTGLGLSITKHLVELHDGEIWVESEEGKGSTFYFSLPKAADKPEAITDQQVGIARINEFSSENTAPPLVAKAPSALAEPGAAGDKNTKIRLLIVDDEQINQQVLSNHLSSEHYQITMALNGEEALNLIDSGLQFDLILLDLMMPRMSGYEVCQRLREKHLPSELPIIMVTAKNQVRDLVQGLDIGANDYLAKPFSRDEFLARVKTQLNLHNINSATGKFVPNEFLHSLGRENITQVRLGDHVEREVSVMFSDIRDYTRLAESMTPEENFNFVNSFNRRLGPIIYEYGGFVNQYLGDAIMAIFLSGPENALRASIGMQQGLQVYNEARRKKQRLPVRIGLGFHTGPLIMGIIGDKQRMDAATISDTVNTAARVESLNKYYGTNILLSEYSLKDIPDPEAFHFRYLGKVQMKGKNVPLGIYECFDGDLPERREKKKTTLPVFEEGLQSYFDKEFSQAIKILEGLVKEDPEDETARLFLNKAMNYMSKGLPEGWTGVEVMETK